MDNVISKLKLLGFSVTKGLMLIENLELNIEEIDWYYLNKNNIMYLFNGTVFCIYPIRIYNEADSKYTFRMKIQYKNINRKPQLVYNEVGEEIIEFLNKEFISELRKDKIYKIINGAI